MNWLAPTGNSGVADYARVLHASLPDVPGVTVFHLGNNPLHEEIYRRLLSRRDPKRVVILHDAVLHHFLLGSLSRDAYIEEFVYNTGEWNRSLAQDLWARRAQSAAIAAAYEAGRESSHRHELQSAAVGALIAVVQDVASRAVPPLMDYLTASLARDQPRNSETTGESQEPLARQESPG